MVKRDKRSVNDKNREENRYCDGKHYSKKHNNGEKKSRNNSKQDLRKEWL